MMLAHREPLKMSFSEPVVAALSEPGETRWGFHQFPNLSRRPDGSILLTWADAEDAHETHGCPAPAMLSRDAGATWEPYEGMPRPLRPHYSISAVFDGEYLVMPAQPYLEIDAIGAELPEPAAVGNVYGRRLTWRVADLPPAVQEYYGTIPALRWTPQAGQWQPDTVTYDRHGMLASTRADSRVLPRTFFERPLLQYEDELLYADYRGRYALPDGTITPKGASSLMVSRDNGKSFQHRAIIAADPEGRDLYGEPQLAPTADGRLVCIIRKTDQEQKPMAITWSADAGRTWSPPRELFTFGVWPCVLRLGNGVLVLCYGRPGVHLRFDAAGTGEQWSAPISLIEGSPDTISAHSCGYTCLLPLDAQSFLVAYSDFRHRTSAGVQHKAILIRHATVERRA